MKKFKRSNICTFCFAFSISKQAELYLIISFRKQVLTSRKKTETPQIHFSDM